MVFGVAAAVAASAVAGGVASMLWSSRNAVAFAKEERPCAFTPGVFHPFPLISFYSDTHESKVLRFALPQANLPVNLPVASYVLLRYKDASGEEVVRPYTPISRPDQPGYFEILVKKYPNGKMSSHLHNLPIGEKMEVSGPIVQFPIRANQFHSVGMIVGGTGVTPAYQILRTLLKQPEDKTEWHLLYNCRHREDVVLGNELNELVMLYPRFSVHYALSKPTHEWMGGMGRVSEEMVRAFMPRPSATDKSVILVCGPPGLHEACVRRQGLL